MGACGSSLTAEEKAAQQTSRKLDREIRITSEMQSRKVKLLLLGAGESGKSTIFKQMRILYGAHHGYTSDELERFKPSIFNSILTNTKVLLENTKNHTAIENEELLAELSLIDGIRDGCDANIDSKTGKLIREFWNDPSVQETWQKRSHFQVQDALSYYCENMDRIASDDYCPNFQDILRTRIRTSGIVTETYNIDRVTFEIYDVGGQRNERKKWIHCFDDATAVIFVAAVSEYDQVLFEDQSMSRIDEAVTLFDEICNSHYFKNTAMILFLNKNDLLRDKLGKVPFRVDSGPEARFTDYKGPVLERNKELSSAEFEALYDSTLSYLLNLFLNRNRSKADVYYRYTCATDTENVELVFSAAKDIILNRNLEILGFTGGI